MPEADGSPTYQKLKAFLHFVRPKIQGLEEADKATMRRQWVDKRIDTVAVKKPRLSFCNICTVVGDSTKPRFDSVAMKAGLFTQPELMAEFDRTSLEIGLMTQAALLLDAVPPLDLYKWMGEFLPEFQKAQAAAPPAEADKPAPSQKPLPPKIQEQLGGIKSLWSMPAMLTKLQEMLATPDTPMAVVAKEIEKDPGLAGQVLRVVNSAYTGVRQPINSIPRAVTMLGYRTTSRLVATSAMISTLGKARDDVKFDLKSYWGHSLHVAHMASILSEKTGKGVPEEIFSGGLMHDIGKLVEYQHMPLQITKIIAAVKNGAPYEAVEERLLGFNHAVLGACVCESWKFADGVVEAVRRHLDPLDAIEKDPPPPEALLVTGACAVQKTAPTGAMLERWCALMGAKPDMLSAASNEATTRSVQSLREVFMQM